MLSRFCEEFHCLPSQAWREVRRLPHGMLHTILEYRLYAAAYVAYDARGRPRGWEPPILEIVKAIDLAVAAEELEEARRG